MQGSVARAGGGASRAGGVPGVSAGRHGNGAADGAGDDVANGVAIGQQFEVVATINPVSCPQQAGCRGGGSAGVMVLQDGKEGTKIGVDFDAGLVYVDATAQGNAVVRAGPLLG